MRQSSVRSERVVSRAGVVIVLVVAAGLLDGCGISVDGATESRVDVLKGDPMGSHEPGGFTRTKESETDSDLQGTTTGRPTQARWIRQYEATAVAPDSAAALGDLAEEAAEQGWQVEYTGPSDVTAVKSIDGETAVLYAMVTPHTMGTLSGSERYRLRIALQG